MNRTIKNITKAPVVLLVRLPIMLTLYLLVDLGEWAQKAGEWLQFKMPAFE